MKTIRATSGPSFGLWKCYGKSDLLSRRLKLSTYQHTCFNFSRLLYNAYWVALSISFKNCPLYLLLANWCKRLSFWPISLSLIISSFYLSERCATLLSLKPLEAFARLLTRLISINAVSEGTGCLRKGLRAAIHVVAELDMIKGIKPNWTEERREKEEPPVGRAVRIHTAIKFAVLYGQGLWCPKTIIIATSKINDHKSSKQT